ncbi:hypothetical protein Ait01nite_029270 [Actinoplanes italicus]|uniref:Hsp70 protein n=1 Tax=Actinoplanes italicus TaxID=113567 RepID=A0A2T0KIM3_9ACTN|nr:Hsp70 family protein [Actinoplanes italicus]PRX23382.1 Hsp70 protein [Actinoplanes italicus]GIE29882.1 hypothetical protein Ait01nite_029270 [Actinoplanes italicus]
MYALGIDLGTTYTAAAVWRSGHAEIASLGSRSAAIPSVVLLRADETVLTGEIASRRGLTEPHRVAREFKRRLGDPTPILLGGVPYSAESLMARMLRAVVDEVSSREGGEPDRICVSHPANWGPYKIDLMYQVIRLAGIEQPVQLTTEPQAAAVFYAQQQRLEPGEAVAVYDLGGGTFDAAVLRKTPDGFELIGKPEGIERLGGIDFDAAIYAHVARSLDGALDDLDEDDPAVTAAVARLREDCVQAKEALSADTDVTIPVLLPELSTEVRLTRSELEAMVRPVLHGPIEALRRAIRSAGIEAADLHSVLLVGGSSRIPLVAQMVGSELGRPVAVDAHPKHAVALGAAWQAGAVISDAGTALVLPEAVDPWATGAAEAVAAGWPGDAAPPPVPLLHPAQSQAPAPDPAQSQAPAPDPARSQAPAPDQAEPTAAIALPAGAERTPAAVPGRSLASVLVASVVAAVLIGIAGTAWALGKFSDEKPDGTTIGAGAGQHGMQNSQNPAGHDPDAASGAAGAPSGAAGAPAASASAAAGPVPADEACTDQMKQSTRWVCLTRATVRDGKFTLWYEADWNDEKPDTAKGFHLHIYGGDGLTPDESTMGSQVTAHGKYYYEDSEPSVRKIGDGDYGAVGDAKKVCARIAKSGHGLAFAADGSYHTGNCIPIERD